MIESGSTVRRRQELFIYFISNLWGFGVLGFWGFGAFANRDVKKGELLLMEDHLFEATCTRNEEEWNALAPEKQALCLELTDLYA
jgi:hypothetical protein